jgi:DNA-binding MarR family transcriptional regulator
VVLAVTASMAGTAGLACAACLPGEPRGVRLVVGTTVVLTTNIDQISVYVNKKSDKYCFLREITVECATVDYATIESEDEKTMTMYDVTERHEARDSAGFEAGGSVVPGRKQLRLDSFLPYVLTRLADSIRVEMPVITANEYDVSVPEWRILANLAEHASLNARQIVDLAAMEKSTVSRTVKGLAARGQALYRRIAPQVLDWEKNLLDGLEVGEYRDLLYLLNKLSRRMQALA